MSGTYGSGNKTRHCRTFRASGTVAGWGAAVKAVYVRAIAGGGGGGVGAAGGNAGQYFEGWMDVDGIASALVVIGAGGAIGANGGDTTFNGVAICKGGVNNKGYSAWGAPGIGTAYVPRTSADEALMNGAGSNGADGLANTGAGGGRGAAGGSGYLELTWDE